MSEANGRLRLPPHVVSRSFAAETVLLNIQTGQYHSLDPVAGRMFELLSTTGAVADSVAALIQEYDVAAEELAADVRALVEDLLGRGLLEQADH